MNIVTAEGVGKSYRTYDHEIRRTFGWITGRPSGYSDNWVLRDVSFALGAGESLGILGRNGAGKSTLLKMLAGTVSPTEGHIATHGKVSAILELGVGFNPEFTGRENVVHSLVLMGQTRAEAESAVPEVERFADIGDYFERPLRTYSSGMGMRVAFAAATAFRPDILIIDEALAVGDAYFQAKCFDRIRQLRDGGTALIYVSHSAGDVVKHCDRALFLKAGRMEASGPSREVSNLYLDDLFGKGRPGATAFTPETGQAIELAADAEDRFATRPFYRKDEHRWGDGGASIRDYLVTADGAAFPTALQTHQKLRIEFKVLFEKPVERPVYGLLIKTLDGLFVYGTNSELARSDTQLSAVEAGGLRLAAFELPLMLNSGSYLISVGISEQTGTGELVPLDRRYDSFVLPIENPAGGIGHLDLGARFSLKSIDGGAMDPIG
jgi:lipopolysaccharide transport system ATP-binding protein